MEERLAIPELKMSLRPGNSSPPTPAKIPTIMCTTWILNSTQMSKQLSRVEDTVKIGMVIIIQTNLPVNLPPKENTQEKNNMAMVDTVATEAMVAKAAMAAMAATAVMATKHTVVKQELIKKAVISLVDPTPIKTEVTIPIPILMEVEATSPMEVKVATVATVAKEAMAAMAAMVAMVAMAAIREM